MPTHGSISKAGKVRNQTPKIEKTPRKKKSPKVNNRKKHYKRFILNQEVGQSEIGRRKRGRRRV